MALSVLLAIFFLVSPLLAAPPTPDRFEDAVYIYALFRDTPSCAQLVARLKALPLRPTVILSVEPDPGFLLDLPDGEEQLSCVLSYLQKTSRQAKALFLQDPVFLERREESAKRAALLGAFAARHPGLLRGVQVDVEPYTTEKWRCCGLEGRRAMMRDLHRLLALVREQLGGLPLAMAVPWWYPAVADEIPQASPKALFGVADEIYLMAYGDSSGPVVGGTAQRVLDHVDAPEAFSGTGRVYITLATYEYRSPGHLNKEMEKVRRRLARRSNFAGTAVFHAESPFHVRLLRLISGTVTDEMGKGLPGVEIAANGIRAHSDYTGRFSLRGLSTSRASLTFQKPGFRTQKLSISLSKPGRERELRTIALEKDPEAKLGDGSP